MLCAFPADSATQGNKGIADRILRKIQDKEYVALDPDLMKVKSTIGSRLVRLLKSSDPEVVRRAMQALVAIEYKVVPSLLPLLDSKILGWSYKVEVAESLSRYEDNSVTDAFIAQLAKSGQEKYLQQNLIHLLAYRNNGKVYDVLAKLLSSPDKQVSLRALQTLGTLNDERVVTKMVKLCENGDSEIRRAACIALANHPGKNSIEAVLRLLQDKDTFTRNGAYRVIGIIGTKTQTAVINSVLKSEPDPATRIIGELVVMRLAKSSLRNRMIERKVKRIFQEYARSAIKGGYVGKDSPQVKLFRSFGPAGHNALIQIIDDGSLLIGDGGGDASESIMYMSLFGLGLMQAADPVAFKKANQSFLNDKTLTPSFRFVGLSVTSGTVMDESFAQEIITLVENEKENLSLRSQAISCLRNAPASVRDPALVKLTQNGEVVIRKSAFRTIGDVAGSGWNSLFDGPLKATMSDPEPEMRLVGVRAMESTHYTHAGEAYRRLLSGEIDCSVQVAACRVQTRRRDHECLEPLMKIAENASRILEVPVSRTARGTDSILNPCRELAEVADRALCLTITKGDVSYIDHLVKTARFNGDDTIRTMASNALLRIGEPSLPALIKDAQMTRTRTGRAGDKENIQWTIFYIGGKPAVKYFDLEMKGNNRLEDRSLAMAALYRLGRKDMFETAMAELSSNTEQEIVKVGRNIVIEGQTVKRKRKIEAVKALGMMGDVRAYGALRMIFTDTGNGMQWDVGEALRKLGIFMIEKRGEKGYEYRIESDVLRSEDRNARKEAITYIQSEASFLGAPCWVDTYMQQTFSANALEEKKRKMARLLKLLPMIENIAENDSDESIRETAQKIFANVKAFPPIR